MTKQEMQEKIEALSDQNCQMRYQLMTLTQFRYGIYDVETAKQVRSLKAAIDANYAEQASLKAQAR